MPRRFARLAAPFSASLFVFAAACGGSDTSLGPDPLAAPTAAAAVTPAGATIERGSTTTATVVFSVTGGLRINKIIVSRPFAGITIVDKETVTEGTTITRTFTIGADNTIPIGAHKINFKPGVTGYSSSAPPPITNAIFTLTVTE